MRDQNDFLIGEQSKLQASAKALNFFKQEALQAKTKNKLLQMEVDKRNSAYQEKEMEVIESKRLQ